MNSEREHIFSSEMMYERERQLMTALLDCTGVCYDVNFTQNKILGDPIQIIDGEKYHVLEEIGMDKNCKYTDLIEYWASKMPKEAYGAFLEFADIDRIKNCYDKGERILRHIFPTYDVHGNSMLAEQKIVLYKDVTNGDLLGISYASNVFQNQNMKGKENELIQLYREATHRAQLLQAASKSIPGGYHRCLADPGCSFLFVSHSFEELVGYTKEQLKTELDNKFINLVIPEDLKKLISLKEQIIASGSFDVTYRIRRRDGQIRWIQDSTLLSKWDDTLCFQSTIADITDFVNQQQELAREKAEFESLAENIPCGYHRCTTDGGFKLEFVSDSFLETVGYERDEILGKPFFDLVAPEDREKFMAHEPQLASTGRIDLVYRLVRKDGTRRWIKDSTMKVTHKGRDSYQCILADISTFVTQQENMLRENIELERRKSMLEELEKTMPGGYHRCSNATGWPFIYFGTSFEKITGWTKEEIENDFGNLFINLVLDEDIPLCAGIINDINTYGYSNAIYRIKRKGGGYIWVSDSTARVKLGDETFYHGVLADVSSEIEAMEKAKQEAEESNLAKSTFLFNAAHDIRTPMNAIMGFTRVISANPDNIKLINETVKKIQIASNTLLTLLNDVLDLSRIERGKDTVNEQPIDMKDHAEKLYEVFREDIERAGLSFHMENNIVHPHVLADDLKLTRIAINLLSNARKFTPAGGSVYFGIRESGYDGEGAVYTITVRDTGIGMSDEFQKRAFDQFERERSSTESGITGSGLGLAIIKRLTDLMGGSCNIESELGVGTEIKVSIPLKLSREHAKPSIEHEKIDLRGKKALIVEDNDFNREIAKYIFEDLGVHVEEAKNGVACLDKIIDSPDGHFDFVLMDIQMPIMDGYKATEEIRSNKNPYIANIPIIAMTANAFEEDRQRCFEVGMNGHISKPIEADLMLKELKRVLDT